MTVPPAIAPFVPDLEAGLASAPSGIGRFWRFERSARPPSQVRAFAVVCVRGVFQMRQERTERVEIPEASAAPRSASGGARRPPGALRVRVRCLEGSARPPLQRLRTLGWSAALRGVRRERQRDHRVGPRGRRVSWLRGPGLPALLRVRGVHSGLLGRRRLRLLRGRRHRPLLPARFPGRTDLDPSVEARDPLVTHSLQLPLDAQVGSGPYRDVPRSETDFHGFEYERALVDARRYVTNVFSRSHRARLSLLVVPLLEVTWSSFARRQRALVLGIDGRPEWLADSR